MVNCLTPLISDLSIYLHILRSARSEKGIILQSQEEAALLSDFFLNICISKYI